MAKTSVEKAVTATPAATAKAPGKKRAAKKRSMGEARRKTSSKRGPGKRYSKAEKARIMAAAKKGNMTGAEAAEKFGISTLTFYRWRGPVRRKKAAKRGPGRPRGSGKVEVKESDVRRAVQEQIRKILPRIIQEEVAAALGKL
jgi:transposase-like protein